MVAVFPSSSGHRTDSDWADTSYDSLGKALLPLATQPGKPTIFVEMDVVKADIAALIGLDPPDREFLMADTVANRLTKRGVAQENGSYFYFDKWHVSLLRSKSGHVCVEMDSSMSIMFTKSQLS